MFVYDTSNKQAALLVFFRIYNFNYDNYFLVGSLIIAKSLIAACFLLNKYMYNRYLRRCIYLLHSPLICYVVLLVSCIFLEKYLIFKSDEEIEGNAQLQSNW